MTLDKSNIFLAADGSVAIAPPSGARHIVRIISHIIQMDICSFPLPQRAVSCRYLLAVVRVETDAE